MKKDTLRGIMIGVIALAVYHLIVFLIPFVRNATFWVSYGFTLASCVVVAAAIYIAFIKNPDAKSRFYGFPIARVGVAYGTVQLIGGLLFMILASIVPVWAAAAVCGIALVAALVGLVSAEAVADHIQTQETVHKADTAFMRGLQVKVSQMADNCDIAELKALAEELRFSDPVSGSAISQAEQDLADAVDAVQASLSRGDAEATAQLCKKASALLVQRNRLCKLHK